MHSSLKRFRSVCETVVAESSTPCQIVRRLAPHMRSLVQSADRFLKPAHLRGDPDHYARNLIFSDDSGVLSLFTLVWAPGQRTPIHDHGTWGVVGVVEGVLLEQSFMRVDARPDLDRDEGIELSPGGLVLLPQGAVSTFVPQPDHIHETGVATDGMPALSLHLYGNELNEFNVYDRNAGTRQKCRVACRQT